MGGCTIPLPEIHRQIAGQFAEPPRFANCEERVGTPESDSTTRNAALGIRIRSLRHALLAKPHFF